MFIQDKKKFALQLNTKIILIQDTKILIKKKNKLNIFVPSCVIFWSNIFFPGFYSLSPITETVIPIYFTNNQSINGATIFKKTNTPQKSLFKRKKKVYPPT